MARNELPSRSLVYHPQWAFILLFPRMDAEATTILLFPGDERKGEGDKFSRAFPEPHSACLAHIPIATHL
jgi:hypothetical protein